MKKHMFCFLLTTLIVGMVFSQPGTLDTSFNPGTGFNDYVHIVKVQPDGNFIVAGRFTSYKGVTTNRIIRLLPDGTSDPTFDTGTGANQHVFCVALLPDGKILISGVFTSFDGNSCVNLARLNANGSFDSSFNNLGTGINTSSVDAIEVLPTGKILIGGSFSSYNGTAVSRMACINANGTLDTNFNVGTGANGSVYSFSPQADGKIIIGGGFTLINGIARERVARLNSDGSVDTNFTTSGGADTYVYRTALQPDGKILIGGWFTQYNNVPRKCIARLNSDGSLDTSFNPGSGASGSFIDPILLLSNGKIVVGGRFSSFNGISSQNIVRLNSNGNVDTGFQSGSGANNDVTTIVTVGNEKIMIGGSFGSYNGSAQSTLAQIINCLPTTSAISVATCGSYTAPDNQSYTSSGTKTATLINKEGCDSVITIQLTINPIPSVSMQPLDAYISSNSASISLNGTPEGGTFSGPGVSGNQFNPTIAGLGHKTISYSFTNGSGCSDIARQSTLVYDTTGVVCKTSISVTDTLIINSLTTGQALPGNCIVRIYPNPVKDQLTVSFSNYNSLSGYSLQIINATGVEVFSTSILQPTATIALASWGGSGIYFVRLRNALYETISTKTIILK